MALAITAKHVLTRYDRFKSTPMRRTRSAFCARAPRGQAIAVPASNAMNSCRFIQSPRRRAAGQALATNAE